MGKKAAAGGVGICFITLLVYQGGIFKITETDSNVPVPMVVGQDHND